VFRILVNNTEIQQIMESTFLAVLMLLAVNLQLSACQTDATTSRLNALEILIAEEKQQRMELESQMDKATERLSALEGFNEECGKAV